jgi:hypothetical protein
MANAKRCGGPTCTQPATALLPGDTRRELSTCGNAPSAWRLLERGGTGLCDELACGARFPTGNEETEDFDMAWCPGTHASLRGQTANGKGRKTPFAVLESLDSS